VATIFNRCHCDAAEVQSPPVEERTAFCYQVGRLAVEFGVMQMANDLPPEGSQRLFLRLPGTGRTYVAERPKEWTAEEEEERLAEFRSRFRGEQGA
jgi:hypothetical protein